MPEPCKYYVKGYCRLGDRCKFAHLPRAYTENTQLNPGSYDTGYGGDRYAPATIPSSRSTDRRSPEPAAPSSYRPRGYERSRERERLRREEREREHRERDRDRRDRETVREREQEREREKDRERERERNSFRTPPAKSPGGYDLHPCVRVFGWCKNGGGCRYELANRNSCLRCLRNVPHESHDGIPAAAMRPPLKKHHGSRSTRRSASPPARPSQSMYTPDSYANPDPYATPDSYAIPSTPQAPSLQDVSIRAILETEQGDEIDRARVTHRAGTGLDLFREALHAAFAHALHGARIIKLTDEDGFTIYDETPLTADRTIRVFTTLMV